MEEKELKEYGAKIGRVARALAALPHEGRVLAFGQGKSKTLFLLSEKNEGMTPGELSDILNVGSGRIGNLLHDLEETGYISRESDCFDKRKTIVVLTEKGKDYVVTQGKILQQLLDALITRIGKNEFNQFLDLYAQIAEILLDIVKKGDRANV